jgi:hypothetical protein
MAMQLARPSGPGTRALALLAAATVALAAGPVACSRARTAVPGRQADEQPQEAKAAPSLAASRAVPAAAERAVDKGPGAGGGTGVPPALGEMTAGRKLVRTGRLSIEVASFAGASEKAVRLSESLGGYLADSQESRSPHGKLRGSLTLRVPAERFAALLEGLRELGSVQSENVSAQDVTRAYADLETRLRVKRDTIERLRQILATRTAKLADVLQAERELARVVEATETLEGERRFYDQQVALSTVTVELVEPEPLVRAGFLEPIRRALADSLELLGGSIAALLALVVIAAPWAVALALAWWLVRRLRARRRTKA